jgi:hypothetical protein
VMKKYRDATNELAGEWRDQSLSEWRALLEAKLT